jgi:hypothetical protein
LSEVLSSENFTHEAAYLEKVIEYLSWFGLHRNFRSL